MMLPRFLSAAALAGLAASIPLTAGASLSSGLQRRQASNCTEYEAPDGGFACVELPSDCTATYIVQPFDSCASIASIFNNFTLSIFHYWNPDVGPDCLSIEANVPVCINTPWYTFSPPVQRPVGTVAVAANFPPTEALFPLVAGAIGNCTKFELAGEGVYEYQMATTNNISFAQFEAWNPNSQFGTSAGYWYCVGV